MEKTIAFMFDIGGTLSDINYDMAKDLISKIETYRIKFNADKAYICISTLYDDAEELKYICGILKKHLTENILFGTHFYLNGTYEYETGELKNIHYYYNGDKISVFYDLYVNNMKNNQFVALFDDSFYGIDYLKYQSIHPVFLGIPNNGRKSTHDDNMMCMQSKNYGTQGVLELLDKYYEIISDKSIQDIIDMQKGMRLSFEKSHISYLIQSRNFRALALFFESENVKHQNYANILSELNRLSFDSIQEDEYEYLEIIINKMLNYFENIKNEYAVNAVNDVKAKIRRH